MDSLQRIDAYLAREAPPTPCVVVDLLTIRQQYRALRDALPDALIYYAVKANPVVPVLEALSGLDIGFDLASTGEIDRCLALGIAVERFCFGNTIKRERDIAWAHSLGIDLFAFDSPAELDKLARAAPGVRVFCRLSIHGRGAEWPLTRKFGCSARMASELLIRAKLLGLRPVGVSFHVGSQQTDPMQWAVAIGIAADVFRDCARQGIALELLNVGGGLPAHYRAPVPPLSSYAEAILSSVSAQFGSAAPCIMVEPGRYLVGDAGVLRSQVLLIARHGRRWVYLDAGRYNGLAETQGEAIQYALRTQHDLGPCDPVVLAGPTCDSTDIIYDRAHYELPLDLAIGDTVDFLSAGAYTASYASVEFNGFPPLAVHCI
jgi:ornithine decarboxylase